jgi:hypothetical protein
MSATSHGRIARGAARVLAGIVTGALVTGIATIAGARTAPPAVASADESRSDTGADLTLYLQSSERAHQAAALDRASRASIGSAIAWTDSYTHASGRVVALREFVGFGGAPCREYRVVVDVPRRNDMVWMGNAVSYNNTVPRQMPVQVSPPFTREFVTNACGAPVGLASATRR